MKALIYSLSLLSLLCVNLQAAEYIVWTNKAAGGAGREIVLAEGEILEVVTFLAESSATAPFQLDVEAEPGNPIRMEFFSNAGTANPQQLHGSVFVGPSKIRQPLSESNFYLVFKKTVKAEREGVIFPQNAVVIPEDTNAAVEIVLETTKDLDSGVWNAALPGTYGSLDSKRFFRVRAITKAGN